MDIVSKIIEIIGYVLMLSLAVDTVQWAVSGNVTGNGPKMITSLIDSVTSFPIKILQLICNLVVGILTAIVKMVLSLISSSIADSFRIEPITV